MSSYKNRHIPFYFNARRPLAATSSVTVAAHHDSLRSPTTSTNDSLALDIASHDLPRPRLRELREDLEIANMTGHMVTFDVATGRWVDWIR
jgi:hypothetical protein